MYAGGKKMYSETIAVEPRGNAMEVIDKVKRLVAESRVRGLLPEGMRMSSNAIDGLDQAVRRSVEFAVVRCQANKRKTICREDF